MCGFWPTSNTDGILLFTLLCWLSMGWGELSVQGEVAQTEARALAPAGRLVVPPGSPHL